MPCWHQRHLVRFEDCHCRNRSPSPDRRVEQPSKRPRRPREDRHQKPIVSVVPRAQDDWSHFEEWESGQKGGAKAVPSTSTGNNSGNRKKATTTNNNNFTMKTKEVPRRRKNYSSAKKEAYRWIGSTLNPVGVQNQTSTRQTAVVTQNGSKSAGVKFVPPPLWVPTHDVGYGKSKTDDSPKKVFTVKGTPRFKINPRR